MDRLESIVKTSQSSCSIVSGHSVSSTSTQVSGPSSSGSSSQSDKDNSQSGDPSSGSKPADNDQGQSLVDKLEEEIKKLQNQIASFVSGSSGASSQTEKPPQGDSNQNGNLNGGRPNGGTGNDFQTNNQGQSGYGNNGNGNSNGYGYGSGGNNGYNNGNNNNQNGGRPNGNDNYSGYDFGRPTTSNQNSGYNNGGYQVGGYQDSGRPNNNNYNGGWQITNNNQQQNNGYDPNNNNNNGNGANSNQPQEDPKNNVPINSGFLGGLPPASGGSGENEALSKLNQSQKVDTSDMQNALELTIPNVVSNIFSNIQNLTIQTATNSNSKPIESLTSIDGSSVSVSGSSTEQITALGEQLFLQWIDHQLQSLHLTASMAAYIQRNALSLFRRIVKQYVERVEKLGGKVEDNVRRATQIALNNTQNLISFLLKNYINFAGGIMKILGEQVSRVGKQLDATGETIAHINLNPFDIVSNVIDSLPNPAHYSEYFRAFGKYLMGESSSSSSKGDQQQVAQNDPQHPSENSNNQDRPKGLFSKTMGALGKTLGSWIG